METPKKSQPFLRWAGSKKKALPILREYFTSEYSTYYEPFAGSARLFFDLPFKKAVLSDVNKDLINLYKQIKKDPHEIYDRLVNISISSKKYYEIRKLQNDKSQTDKVDKAVRFLYLNKFCFNGLYRTNSNGDFNVPYSNVIKGTHVQRDFLLSASKKLKNVKLIQGDFEKIIKERPIKNDIVYLDPPYAVNNRNIFNQYGPNSFGYNDLLRLQKILNEMDKKGVKFVLSYAYCKEALDIFKSWDKRKIFLQRNIAGFTDHRRKAAELIFTNI